MKYEILRKVCGLLESCKQWAFHSLPFHRKTMDKISVRVFYEHYSAAYTHLVCAHTIDKDKNCIFIENYSLDEVLNQH